MRTRQALKSLLTLGTAVLALTSGAAGSFSYARQLPPPTADTGYQGPLINRSVCWTGPAQDDWSYCGTYGPQSRRFGPP